MGKEWDHGVPGVEFWTEAMRVAKPGAHLLAFGGTRTFHRLAVAIEDAGWEIRDCVMWVYGSGFPKSHDVSKAIDKSLGAMRNVDLHTKRATKNRHAFSDSCAAVRCSLCGNSRNGTSCRCPLPAPVTDSARKWEGWGTALKPAWEPIIVARKPFVGTVAENVVRYGTGAMNVEWCRVSGTDHVGNWTNARSTNIGAGKYVNPEQSHRVDLSSYAPSGRWPANLIHDGSEEVSDPLGSAARFFYCAKASKADRDDGCEGNHHPTVKPTDLMAYLCRLVTPPGGTVLDPFTGSGSTGRGAMREGFNFIGFELSPEYAEIARARIAACVKSEALF